MTSAGDAEFPREYHTLAHGARRFPDNNNGGLASTSGERLRHNAIATKSVEAHTNHHKVDMERQREGFMDLQRNQKYPASPCGSQGQGSPNCGRQQQDSLVPRGSRENRAAAVRKWREGGRRRRVERQANQRTTATTVVQPVAAAG
ncbi:hypothetical protein DPEC_G00329300 [Dallia pectoralis]|uniref:Uncharacterized protein n=1 Tax=Dallia pectoralis TaxID=75939 RepID=A0ACC2F8P1_DALPE|nr:hypothetical protein DPEC_G00329300 [Dallia pectoralis]